MAQKISGKKRGGTSMRVKILFLAISTLILIVAVSAFTNYRLNQVNVFVIDLAEYIIPARTLINEASVHAFEQILHLERVFKYYEFPEPPLKNIEHEIELFEERGHLVDEELHSAAELIMEKLAVHNTNEEDAAYFTGLLHKLETLEEEHQQFHDHAVMLLDVLAHKQHEHEGVLELEEKLAEEEEHFNQEVHAIILTLEENTQNAVEEVEQRERQVLRLNIFATFLAIALGLLYATVITLKIVKHVRVLIVHMGEVQSGDYTISAAPGPADEIGSLTVSFNSMVRELALKDKIEKTFGQYVDPKIVESLMQGEQISSGEGEKRVMTIFFAEISGLDALVNALSPEELVRFYNGYLDKIAAPITENHGVLNKFIDTTVMGFWGPPFNDENGHEQLACLAAQAESARFADIRESIMHTAGKTLHAKMIKLTVGITTGPVIVGNMGSERSKSYTVMGDVVNAASRLKGAAKQYGVEVLVSDAVRQNLPKTFAVREIDTVRLVGKDEPVTLFQYVPQTSHTRNTLNEQAIQLHQEGLSLYKQRVWEKSARCFREVLRIAPKDYPSTLFLKRVELFQKKPPPEKWDGIWQLSKK